MNGFLELVFINNLTTDFLSLIMGRNTGNNISSDTSFKSKENTYGIFKGLNEWKNGVSISFPVSSSE